MKRTPLDRHALTLLSCLALMAAGNGPAANAESAEPAFLPLPRATGAALATGHPSPGGQAIAMNPRLRDLPRITVPLPDGAELLAERTHLEEQGPDTFVWVGRLSGEPLSEVTLVSHQGAYAGHISRPLEQGNALYAVRTGADGRATLLTEGTVELPDSCSTAAIPKPRQTLSTRPQGRAALAAGSSFPAATASNPAVVDILVVYTPATARRYGGTAGAESLALSAVSSANTGYRNSGVYLTLNLVYLGEVAYTEPGDMHVTLARLGSSPDGYLDEVQPLREASGADLVMLIDEDANFCGTSYQMTTTGTESAGWAYGVVNSGCISQFSFAHEIGHLMGSQHDRENATVGSYAYSFGHKRCTTDGAGFRTVMSYACAGVSVPRVNYFSNPAISFNGYPTGIPETDTANSANNAKSLNNNAHAIKAFRSGPNPPPAAPTSLSATATSSVAIQLSWIDASTNESAFEIERSSDQLTWTRIANVGSNTSGFSDATVSPSSSTHYRVRASNSGGCSAWSNLATATTPASPLPAPATLSATLTSPTSNSVRLTWADCATTETGFQVERIATGGTWTRVASLAADVLTWTDTTTAGGTTYQYRVRATTATDYSPYSSPATVTTPEPVPQVPTNLKAAASGSATVKLTWTDASTNETGFEIQRSTDGVSFATVATTAANSSNYSNGSLKSKTLYSYRLRALGRTGPSAWTPVVSVRAR
jgi:hypothetical protein